MYLIYLTLTMSQANLFGWEEYDPIVGESKVCVKCGVNKPLEAYGVHSGGSYLRTECRKCTNHMSRIRNKIRSEVAMPDVDYTCPICFRSSVEVSGEGGTKAGPWVVDHCHTNNHFRGWLCHKCNRALGGFKDDVAMMGNAIKYLSS